MSLFVRQAEEILEIATNDRSTLGDTLVVLDRQGGFRMLDSAGWSLPALAAEFGAEAVYKVEHQGSSVRVEGWNGSRRCLLQGEVKGAGAGCLSCAPFASQATMLQFTTLALT